ncbi:MAG: iron ABC transporter substrate-binding protein [Solirubrobacterales bacterium]
MNRSLTLLCALAVLLVLAACGSDSDDQADTSGGDTATATADEITVYSGREKELVEPLLDRFTEETGVKLNVRYGDSAELAATLIEEGDASPADVYFGQDAGALGALQKDGRLEDLPSDLLRTVDGKFRSREGSWVGTSGRVRVIAYDSREVSESDLPQSVIGLSRAQWADKVGYAPTNGSFQAFVTAMRKVEGEGVAKQWLEGLVENDARTYDGNTAIRDAIADGEIQLGLINHYYVVQAREEEGDDYPVKLYFPPGGDVGSLINVAGAGIVTGSEEAATAEQFIRFLLNKESQTYFADETKEYPLIDGVEPDSSLPALSEIQQPGVDLSDLDDLEGTTKLIERTGAL